MIVLLPIVRAIPAGTFYEDIAAGVGAALQELGHTVQWFPLGNVGILTAAEAEAAVRWARGGGRRMVLDLCCWGHALSSATLATEAAAGAAAPLFDSNGIPCMAVLYDQAWFQPIGAIRAKRLYAAYPDPSVLEQLRLVEPGLALAGSVFSPPAVRTGGDRSRPWGERDIDLLYVGNLRLDALERPWHRQADTVLHDALADAASIDVPLHRTAIEVARTLGREPTPHQWGELLRDVEFYLRAKSRLACVRAAARSGARLHVMGDGWEQASLPAGVEVHALGTYPEFLDIAGRSRLCLDSSSYPGGVNDRVFHYALNGAVTLTNSKDWLQGALGAGVHFYRGDAPEDLAERIPALLADTDGLREAGEEARREVLAHHTWKERVAAMMQCVTGR